MKKNDNYSIGLDIGTGSVGWAVINSEYSLCKLKGKDAWGAFIFDDAKTASSRRAFRAQRRRYERRRERIRLLQELMSDLVLEKDESFFIRLKESTLKSNIINTNYKRSNHYNLFEGDYTDKDFYNDYKTIYHLRNRLCESQSKEDIRLIYLALHHIIKYRGNFLYEGKKLDSNKNMLLDNFNEFFVLLQDYENESYHLSLIEKIIGILKDKTLTKPIKKDKLKEIFKDDKNSIKFQAVFNLLLGNTANLSDVLFLDDKILDGSDKPLKITFSNESYEENEEYYLSLSDERGQLLLCLKSIFYALLSEKITGGQDSISKGMIEKYDKHHTDLKVLKNLLKKGVSGQENSSKNKIYEDMFRKEEGNNYVNYIGSNTSDIHYSKKVTKAIFYSYCKEELNKLPNSEEKSYCLQQIESDNFLPLINSVENAAIPYQMHEKELIQIIDNQSRFYPQLGEIKDKIVAVFEFKRPYYVGPLKGEFSWCEQKINERITPWNFYELVDTEHLENNFIKRLTNYCNVFKEEKVLPQNSIVYSAYVTLNEINKIKLDGKNICTKWKQQIFKELCCQQKVVKLKNIVDKLKLIYNRDIKESDISGLSDSKLNGKMSSYIDFTKKLENFNLKYLDKYEEAISILTIFKDDKVIKKRLDNLGIFNDKEINNLCKLSYSGWGKFSQKLLNGIKGSNGKTIVEVMYETDKNINEILFDKELCFQNQIVDEKQEITNFDYKRDVKDLYCSPSVKKSIWNALKIVDEIVKIAKCPPTGIFLEDTREIKEKVKTDSRVSHLMELYKSIENNEYFNQDCDAVLKEYKNCNKKLDNDKLYLWLIQLGRCMYSNEVITLDNLQDCEIDHIVPRSYIKDDSFENRVLVKKIENQNKTNTLSISPNIQIKMKSYWKFLYDKKLLGNKKWINLTRGEYTEEDKKGFINRQLVETSQIVKEVRKILENRFKKTKIMGIRASLNSVMRNKYRSLDKAGFYKIRSLNNLHHAKDAFLTAVLGQFTTTACPFWGQQNLNKAYKYFIVHNEESNLDVHTLANKRFGIVVDLLESNNTDNFLMDENGEYMWDDEKYMNIFRTMEKNNCLIVKKQRYFANSDFYKQTIYGPRSKKTNLLPLKAKNGEPMPAEIYGGYSEEHPAYFAIVEYIKEGKKNQERKYELAQIPLQKVAMLKNDENAVANYISEKFGKTAQIIKIVKMFQLLKVDGHLCYLTGEGELNNAVELIVDSKFEQLLYNVEKNKLKDDEKTSLVMKEFALHYCDIIRNCMPLYIKFADKIVSIVEENFDALSIEEKKNLIKAMLIVADTGAGRASIDKNLGGGEFGRLSKKIVPNKVEWINNSCTGLYSTINYYGEH